MQEEKAADGAGPVQAVVAVGQSVSILTQAGRLADRSDMRSAQLDAEDDHLALQSATTPTKLQTRQHTMLEHMGLEDPDDAVQYAMMLSMEESNGGSGSGQGLAGGNDGASRGEDGEGGYASDGEAAALEAVRQMEEAEKREREEVLEVVRRAEMRGE
jgi:hypothetical protein